MKKLKLQSCFLVLMFTFITPFSSIGNTALFSDLKRSFVDVIHLESFHSLSVVGSADIHLIQGTEYKIHLEGPEELSEYIETKNQQGKLTVSFGNPGGNSKKLKSL